MMDLKGAARSEGTAETITGVALEVAPSQATPPSTATTAPDRLKAGVDPLRHRARERRRTLARRLRRGLLAAAILTASVGVVLALRPRPVPVDVARTSRGPLQVIVQESGKTRVKDRYVVSTPAAGSLSRLALEPGDFVKEGDVLGEIAPALSPLLDQRSRAEAQARLGASLSALGQARAQVARAAAARELADRELARVARLVGTGSMPRQPLDQADFEARMRVEEHASAVFGGKVAAEEVRLARVALGEGGAAPDRHVDIHAPTSGRVLRVFQKSAGVVPAGTPLAEVGDPAALEVVVDLLTTVAVQVRPGTPVTIQDWGGEGPLAGRVRLIEPSGFTRPSALGVDEQRVNAVVAITAPRASWTALGDGYRVETRLVLWRGDDVVRAPQGAVFRHGDGWAVFRIEAGRAVLVPIQVGHRGETEVEILSGLPADATVAVHPGDRVKPGVRVEAR
jgi:HlyD family secretion protein